MTNTEGDDVTEDRNNSPVFTDDEGCAAYDALYCHLRVLKGEYKQHMSYPDAEPPYGLSRAIAAAEGAMNKLGHDR